MMWNVLYVCHKREKFTSITSSMKVKAIQFELKIHEKHPVSYREQVMMLRSGVNPALSHATGKAGACEINSKFRMTMKLAITPYFTFLHRRVMF